MRLIRFILSAGLRLPLLAALTAGVVATLASAPSDAQYFGRNKVLWERFEFEVLETEHYLIHYYPPEADHAAYVADLAERWHVRLAAFFDHELDGKKPLIIYRNHADFQQTVVTTGLIGEGTGGFTESALDRVVLPLTGINADNDHVIGHELVHVFQFDLAAQQERSQFSQMPLWMVEGLAEYLTQGRIDPTTAMWMRDAVLHSGLPETGRLIQRQPSPYQYGQAIWAYIAGRWGDETVARLYRRASEAGPAEAFRTVLGVEIAPFLATLHAALGEAAAPVLDIRSAPADIAVPLLTAETTGASVNLAPSLSPDGRRIAFMSTRALELELYLADAETGEVLDRLVRAEADPHVQNLSFVDARVTWSPDGRRFAFGVFARGQRAIAIYDLERRRVERRLDLPGIDDMRHPAWSPDGRSMVFSAIVGGASDLYRVDLSSGDVVRLTEDPYTAIQPAVSPDGKRIAFVTERGGAGTDIDRLAFGDLQIAILDNDTGQIEVLPLFERGKHIDPHFSRDGRSLYFVAEPDGVQDVFRYDFAGETIERITHVQTGVSGVTATSPALSVAGDGTLAFSVLDDSGFDVYLLRDPSGEQTERRQDFTAAMLPPVDADLGLVERYLADPDTGLPPRGIRRPTRDYKPRIGLTAIAPAAAGVVSLSGRGTGLGGAVSAYFTDPLNRHQIIATFQGGSTYGPLDFQDTIAADVSYLNQTRRFQWGARLSRIPYYTGATRYRLEEIDSGGESVPAEVIERLILVERATELALLGRYPLSLNSRFEAAIGVANIDFKGALERIVYPSGAPAYYETRDLPSPEALDLSQASLAFVRDTSTYAFVSPVRGMRLRIENQWTSGDIDFQTARIDYRRYVLRTPLTFAFRLMHVGRHGSGAEDPRLPLFDIGSSSLVRGYDLDSLDLSECSFGANITGCPEAERLIGSRIAVASFELRLALLGNEDYGLFNVPAAPTELAFFIDAGAAWSSGQSIDWSFRRDTLERVPVFSAGLAARTIVLGMLPLELFYAYPFQRPDESAVFGVRIGGGW